MPACLSSLSNSLAVCTRKPTSPALVTGKPRSLSPDPPASSSASLPPVSQESDMETVTDLKRKSSDSSPKRAKKRKSKAKKAPKQVFWFLSVTLFSEPFKLLTVNVGFC